MIFYVGQNICYDNFVLQQNPANQNQLCRHGQKTILLWRQRRYLESTGSHILVFGAQETVLLQFPENGYFSLVVRSNMYYYIIMIPHTKSINKKINRSTNNFSELQASYIDWQNIWLAACVSIFNFGSSPTCIVT